MGMVCDAINVLRVDFKVNDLVKQFSSDLPVEINPEYGMDEDGDYHLTIKVEIGKDTKKYPFFLNCQFGGVFSFDQDSYGEDQEQILLDEGLELVMSFVRTYVYRLTEDAGFDPLILPRLELERE